MNILDARILLKRSTVAGTVPTIPASSTHTDGSWINTDIYSGEAFLNTQDQRMFVRTGANIKEIPFQNYYVGQAIGGGVVFHVYKGADKLEHGLICSIVDQSTSSQYSNITNQSIGASNSWDGQSNTNLMASQTSASTGAWKFANDYSYGGFTDWYLPSIDEISLLSNNRYNVNKTLSSIGGASQIQDNFYWTSSEYTDSYGWGFTFFSKYAEAADKTGTYRVRAIRQF